MLRSHPSIVFVFALAASCTDRPSAPPSPPPAASNLPSAPESAKPERRTSTGPLRLTPRMGFGPADRQIIDDNSLPAAGPAATAPAEAPPADPGFLDPGEPALLERLRKGEVSFVKKGSGGRTLAFRLLLTASDGTQLEAYFKPEQRVSSANWYAEVAAYYLDRALGLGRVPPVVSRKLPWALFSPAADGDPRQREVVVDRNGEVRGALIAWLPGKLVPAVTPPGWENWIRNEPFPKTAVTPYQRAAAYSEALAEHRGKQARREPPTVYYNEPPTPNRPELPAELSDMILFDFLTLNYDRFGGDNANVLTLGERGPLIFLDNGDAFSRGPIRRSLLDGRLSPLSKFRERTIEALRSLDLVRLKANLATDALGPLLDAPMVRGLEHRRRAVLEHVAAQERRFGEKVYAW